jgi:hypothetical protein
MLLPILESSHGLPVFIYLRISSSANNINTTKVEIPETVKISWFAQLE